MKSVRIEGLRSLNDSGSIPIKPLTILLGENSSGKSTFLRTFPLLRQSLESNTRGPILWYGAFVDFGIFDDAVSKFSEDKVISFSFTLDALKLVNAVPQRHRRRAGIDNGDVTVKLSVTSDSKDKSTRIKAIDVTHENNHIEITYSRLGKITTLLSNDIDLTKFFQQALSFLSEKRYGLFPYIKFLDINDGYISPLSEFTNVALNDEIIRAVKPFLHAKTNRKDFLQRLLQMKVSNRSDFFNDLVEISDTVTWKKRISSLHPDSEIIKNIQAFIFSAQCPWMLLMTNYYISNELESVKYIAPLRATAERYYRSQDLSVTEVDFQGKNLAMFIRNLTETERSKYSEWLIDNFGFSLLVPYEGGHLSLRLQYEKSESSYNITDMGFGFCQILPIITQIWYSSIDKPQQRAIFSKKKSEYIVIEQPELHLHPRFQAKLVDAFVKVIQISKSGKSNLKLIIETHSETIINQIGHQISKSQISKDDVSVTLFEKKSPDHPSSIKLSSFNDDGFLVDWPWGFFEPEID